MNKQEAPNHNLFWLGLTLGLLICAIALLFVQTNNQQDNTITIPDVRDNILVPIDQNEPIIIVLTNNAENQNLANQVNLYLSQQKGVGQ